VILAAILTVLALIHVYWASGGKWGASKAIPKLDGGKPPFVPGPAATFSVAALLLFAASISAGLALTEYRRWLMYAMGAVFALRAVGEFRYIGFFKTVRDTEFAYWDTRLYSPLCLLMSVLAWLY
jgi:hypothetical protein